MPRGAALAAGAAAAAAGPARAPGSGPGGAGPGGLTLAEQTGALGRMRRVKAIVARDNILKIAEVGCRFASATAARSSPRADSRAGMFALAIVPRSAKRGIMSSERTTPTKDE